MKASNKQTGLAKATAKSGEQNLKGANTNNTQTIPNFWVRRGDGTAVTIDPYKDVNGISAINSGTDGSSNGFSNKLDLSFASGITKAGGVLSKIKAGITAAAKVKKAFSNAKNPFDAISSLTGVSKDLLSGFNIQEGSALYNQIVAGTNTVATLAKTGKRLGEVDWKNADSISKLLADYTKDNELFAIKDLGAEGAFAANLINEATRNGFPDSFKEISNVVTNSSVLKGVLGDILPVTMSMADMSGLKDMVDFFGGEEVRTLFPSIYEDFSSAYSRNWLDSSTTDVIRYNSIKSVQDALNIDWWKTTRGSETILNLEYLMYGSDDFVDVYLKGLQLVETQDDERKLLSIFNQFKSTDVMSKIKRDFPYTYIKDNTTVAQSL